MFNNQRNESIFVMEGEPNIKKMYVRIRLQFIWLKLHT